VKQSTNPAGTAPAAVIARSRSRRRRVLVLATAALAVTAVAMGVSFLDQSGAAALTISSGGSGNLVYPLGGTSKTLPVGDGSDPLTYAKYSGTAGSATVAGCTTLGSCNTTTAKATGSTLASVTSPSWSPVANSPGDVTTAGDIAVVDATQVSSSASVVVNMYVTNLAALSKDYSSYAFPINVYSTTCPSGTCGPWSATDAGVVTQSPFASFLTDTSGVISFSLPGGKYYDITMESASQGANVGGSFYCISTSTTGGASLSPSFFITASPTA
jgi:hypothetical protein